MRHISHRLLVILAVAAIGLSVSGCNGNAEADADDPSVDSQTGPGNTTGGGDVGNGNAGDLKVTITGCG